MPSLDLLLAFIAATAVFAYMPGPSMLYTAAQTIARGRKAGWFATFGIHIGGYVHVIAAAFGLALLFEAVPVLYMILKFAGAAYLVWLGLKLFLSKSDLSGKTTAFAEKSPKKAFWESVTVEILNPKTALFYVAFLPQFIEPAASFPVWLQLFLLGTVINVMFSSADILCVLMADKVTCLIKGSPGAGRLAQRLGGSILIGLGANIALNRN